MLSNYTPIDIRAELSTQSIGTTTTTGANWEIFIDNEPETPDKCITLTQFQGPPPNPKWSLDTVNIQVMVRSSIHGNSTAVVKMDAVKNGLLGLSPKTINGTRYTSFQLLGEPGYLGKDEKNRPTYVANFQIIREPQTTGGESNRLIL